MVRALRLVTTLLAVLVAAVAAIVGVGRAAGLFSGTSPALGVSAGRLAACNPAPNCVSSQALNADAAHFIAPLAFRGPPAAAFGELRRVVRAGERATVVRDEPGYLRAEYRSRIMGFVDDVEFLLDAEARVIHARSAARLGYRDLGVNRARIEKIRAQLATAGA